MLGAKLDEKHVLRSAQSMAAHLSTSLETVVQVADEVLVLCAAPV